MNDLVTRHFTGRGQGLEFEMEASWLLRRVPRNNAHVLDLGCGIGAILRRLSGCHAIGLDINVDGLVETRRVIQDVPLACAAAESLPLANESMDALMTQHVIEHLTDGAAACAEWFRVLKPGGIAVLLTPNRRFVDPSVFDDETHVHIFDGDDLASTLHRAGFIVEETRTLGLPWFRRYQGRRGAWRLRRRVTRHAEALSGLPTLRWKGQTLCCVARRPSA